MYQGDTLPRIIYIAGYGRSGSTLLDVLLANHPQMVGTGELSSLFLEWEAGDRCTCGEPVDRCAFWTRVVGQLDLTPAEAERVTRTVEASGRRSVEWGAGSPAQTAYARLWRTLMNAIAAESGKPMIVDSSKNSRPAARRIAALRQLCGFDVRVVHLVRDPRATMWSALRGRNKQMEAGQRTAGRGNAYKALMGWIVANAAVHRIHAADPELPVLRMRYEDLVTAPAQTLRRLGQFLEADLTPVIEAVKQQRPFDPGHGLRGNRMRRRGPVRLRLDEEWKTALPLHARLAAPLAWPLARTYGYHVWRTAHQPKPVREKQSLTL